MSKQLIFAPQPGPQAEFHSSPADIVIYGGAAGGGKTWSLLFEPLRHIHNPNFGGVIFRRNSRQVTIEGGLWDESQRIYPHFGGEPIESRLEWKFPCGICHGNDGKGCVECAHTGWGARISMRHMQHDKTAQEFQGSQIPYMGWDEVTHFTKKQFFYLFSRGRSTCGVRPYIRGTCNPDAGSWVKKFLAPWVDDKADYKAESGEILWMWRNGDQENWWRNDPDSHMNDDPSEPTLAEYRAKHAHRLKTVSFISSSIYDNQILMDKNPGYLGNLENLSLVDRRRLLEGDWNIKEGEQMFDVEHFPIVKDRDIPYGTIDRFVRYWDLAATTKYEDKRACYTAGVLMGICRVSRSIYILDVRRVRSKALDVERLVRQTAAIDGTGTEIWMEQEPGASGKAVIEAYARLLLGYTFLGDLPTGNKETRAKPLATAASHGAIMLRQGPWNAAFLNEIEVYPLDYKDQVDAASGALNRISEYNRFVML